MADLKDLIRKLQDYQRFLETDLPKIVASQGGNGIVANIVNRVTQKGLTFTGVRFSPYSYAKLPAGSFKGKHLKNKAADAVASGKALSWLEFRLLNDRKVDKKIFEFSGDMWRNLGVVDVYQESGIFGFVIDGKTPDARKKIEGNSDYEKVNIIQSSDEENIQYANFVNKKIDEYIKSILG